MSNPQSMNINSDLQYGTFFIIAYHGYCTSHNMIIITIYVRTYIPSLSEQYINIGDTCT